MKKRTELSNAGESITLTGWSQDIVDESKRIGESLMWCAIGESSQSHYDRVTEALSAVVDHCETMQRIVDDYHRYDENTGETSAFGSAACEAITPTIVDVDSLN